MKTVAALISTCAALAVVSARPMHAGINYARYLEEKEAVADELDAWMSKYSDDAEINGWIPPAESRDADEVAEDRKQRFFMAKELVSQMKEENPDAEFSTDSPFSLLTPDEFSTYIKNSYLAGGGRQLRVMGGGDNSQNAPNGDGNARAHPFNFRQAIGNWWSGNNNNGGSVRIARNAGDSSGGYQVSESFSFQDLIDWINRNMRPGSQPNGPSNGPSNSPSSRPRPPSAPVTSTPSTQSPPAPRPRPATDAPVTSAPTEAPVVAPTEAPSGPVGPVAPADTPGAAKNEDVVIGADGNGIDWSSNKCMPPVQNQGQCGSCWSFATIAGTETGKCIATKASSYVKLSEQQLATCDTRNMGCNGGATSYAFQYIQQNGVCSGSDVPYTMSNGRTGTCNAGCTKIASGIKSTSRVQGESGLVSALNTHPVVIAVAAGNAAWKQYKSGVLSSCQTTQVDHAVLAVGYDATTFKIRNSWGANWGEAGYIRIKRDSGSTGVCSMYRDMIHANF